jgi:hypothetical protein
VRAKFGECFAVPHLPDDRHVGRHPQEPGHPPPQVDGLAVRAGGAGLHVGHVGEPDVWPRKPTQLGQTVAAELPCALCATRSPARFSHNVLGKRSSVDRFKAFGGHVALYYKPQDIVLGLSWELFYLTGGGNVQGESANLHGEFVWKVTSVSGSALAGVARLQEMIAAPVDVVIIQVSSSFIVPGVTPTTVISDRGGGTTGFTPANPPLWAVWIDLDHCFGNGYYVYASPYNAIPNYASIIIAHELAHISHHINGIQTSEPLATQAENLHRAELGLPLRSVAIYAGGCGPPPRFAQWLESIGGLAGTFFRSGPSARRRSEQLPPETPTRIPNELFRGLDLDN